MHRFMNTLAGRLTLVQVVLYVALMPLLFFKLQSVVRSHLIGSFTRDAHAYSRSVASELELADALDSPGRSARFLDGSVRDGHCAYAALEFNGRLLGSTLTETPPWVRQRPTSETFGTSIDHLYRVVAPFSRAGARGRLFLGFDEGPTLNRLSQAGIQILVVLGIYTVASLAAALYFARRVSRPLSHLQRLSREVTRGSRSARLSTNSSLAEIRELACDLDTMREALAGTAERLRDEMVRREMAQSERSRLENQLQHEQRLATVGSFAGGLAHEFNNILVPLILYTEDALEEIGATHPAHASLQRVVNAATRAGNVVARMLAYSRPHPIDSSQIIDFNATIREAFELCQALIPADITVRLTISGDGARVRADPTLVNQIVLNLCSNAVQAMQGHGGTLTVTLTSAARAAPVTCEQQAARRVALSVADTGHGMDEATLQRVFEPFFTTRPAGEGTGLGMSVVHRIVCGMGGTIHASSEPGVGTEFVIDLPAVGTED